MTAENRPIKEVAYVPKPSNTGQDPWVLFGASRSEYEQWIPHVCGICCLKMAGDTCGKTKDASLYELTMRCFQKGGFRIASDNSVQGVFHHPLLELAREIGIEGEVVRSLDEEAILKALSQGRVAILSVDLHKAAEHLHGAHLILVHSYDPDDDAFVLHDCSSVLAPEGRNVKLPRQILIRISNRKGLVFSL